MRKADNQSLINFIVRSHLHTYAKEGAEYVTNPFGRKEISFKEQRLMYQDSYFNGEFHFIGHESVAEVFAQGKGSDPDRSFETFWSMVYQGTILDHSLNKKEIYAFLRKALREIEYHQQGVIPVRGPAKFILGSWCYTNEVTGGIMNFAGEEAIYYEGKKVYSCRYKGCVLG